MVRLEIWQRCASRVEAGNITRMVDRISRSGRGQGTADGVVAVAEKTPQGKTQVRKVCADVSWVVDREWGQGNEART